MKETVVLYPGIHLGYSDAPICFASQAAPLEAGQYQIWEYEFLTKPELANGCFFIIPPRSQTAIAYITDPDTIVTLHIEYGSGQCPYTHWLEDMVDAQRQIVDSHLIRHGDILEFRKGDIYCLQADSDGLVVRDVTTPPFRPGITEINLDPEDHRIPPSLKKFINKPTHIAPGMSNNFRYYIQGDKVTPIARL